MNEHEMKTRFEELAPWHVNGTLAAPEREWVERYVREHPEAAAELRWYESLQTKLKESAPAIGEEYGWSRLHARIRAERKVKPTSLSERATTFLGNLIFSPRPALVYAAMALVVVQAGVIGYLLTEQNKPEDPLSDYRKLATAGEELGPVLKVSFKAEAQEREIRTLLVSMGGTLVGGPGQLGDYIIRVPAKRIDAARDALAASGVVENVQVMHTVPSKE